MAAALLALLVPLRSFTTARSAAPVMADRPEAATETVRLQLNSTAVPITFSVSYLGKVIWRGEAAASPVEKDVAIIFPTAGVDFSLEATWPSGQTAAIKLSVSRAGDEPIAQTVWGDGAVNEVLTFK